MYIHCPVPGRDISFVCILHTSRFFSPLSVVHVGMLTMKMMLMKMMKMLVCVYLCGCGLRGACVLRVRLRVHAHHLHKRERFSDAVASGPPCSTPSLTTISIIIPISLRVLLQANASPVT